MAPLPQIYDRSPQVDIGQKVEVKKRWLPLWIRVPVQVVFLPFVLLDVLAQRVARFCIKPPHKKEGFCKKRGACCRHILMEQPKGVWGSLYLLWNTQINGFYPKEERPFALEGKRLRSMGCRYLKRDGRCGNYFLRPMVCRLWPEIERFGEPRILKGCGYRAQPRKK